MLFAAFTWGAVPLVCMHDDDALVPIWYTGSFIYSKCLCHLSAGLFLRFKKNKKIKKVTRLNGSSELADYLHILVFSARTTDRHFQMHRWCSHWIFAGCVWVRFRPLFSRNLSSVVVLWNVIWLRWPEFVWLFFFGFFTFSPVRSPPKHFVRFNIVYPCMCVFFLFCH